MTRPVLLIVGLLAIVAASSAGRTVLPPGLRNFSGIDEFLDMKGNACGKCTWKCEEPNCPGPVCHPVCKPADCETRCAEPDAPVCHTKCKDPVCHIRCQDVCPEEHKAANGGTCPPPSDHNCHEGGEGTIGCPPCDAVCEEPVCEVTCETPKSKCTDYCKTPDCNWDCKKPECAEPTCKLVCDDPNEKCHKHDCCHCQEGHAHSDEMKPATLAGTTPTAGTIVAKGGEAPTPAAEPTPAPAPAPAAETPAATTPAAATPAADSAPATPAATENGKSLELMLLEMKLATSATKCCSCNK